MRELLFIYFNSRNNIQQQNKTALYLSLPSKFVPNVYLDFCVDFHTVRHVGCILNAGKGCLDFYANVALEIVPFVADLLLLQLENLLALSLTNFLLSERMSHFSLSSPFPKT